MAKASGFHWKRGMPEFLIILSGITLPLLADDWTNRLTLAFLERMDELEGLRGSARVG